MYTVCVLDYCVQKIHIDGTCSVFDTKNGNSFPGHSVQSFQGLISSLLPLV